MISRKALEKGVKNSSVSAADFLHAVMDDARLHSLWLNTLSFLEYTGARKIAKALPQTAFNERLLEHFSEETQHSLYFKRLARKARDCIATEERESLSAPEISGTGKTAAKGGGTGRKRQSLPVAASAKARLETIETASFGAENQNPGFKEEELLNGRAARAYFQALDNKAKALAEGNVFLNYLLTSCAVERRAVGVYSLYNRLLKAKRFPFCLDPVLQDEKRHWIAMQEEIQRAQQRRPKKGNQDKRSGQSKESKKNKASKLAALIRFEEAVFPAFLQSLWNAAKGAKAASPPKAQHKNNSGEYTVLI